MSRERIILQIDKLMLGVRKKERERGREGGRREEKRKRRREGRKEKAT